MAVRFNLAGMKVMGQPVSIVENVMQSFSTNSELNTGAGQFAVSDTGRLVYAAGGMVPPPMNSLVWVDRKGNEEPVTDLKAPYSAPRLSPDGRRIAYDAAEIEHPVYVYDLFTDTHSPTVNGWFFH
jgi:hypothetical protein